MWVQALNTTATILGQTLSKGQFSFGAIYESGERQPHRCLRGDERELQHRGGGATVVSPHQWSRFTCCDYRQASQAVSGTVTITPPQTGMTSAATLRFRSIKPTLCIEEQIQVGDTVTQIGLRPGPYLLVDATNATLTTRPDV